MNETTNETTQPYEPMTGLMYCLVRVAEDRRFELLRVTPNTLSNTVAWRSPASAAVRQLREHDLSEHR
jgi:hypothetical protein